jgi:hypothetical protein
MKIFVETGEFAIALLGLVRAKKSKEASKPEENQQAGPLTYLLELLQLK